MPARLTASAINQAKRKPGPVPLRRRTALVAMSGTKAAIAMPAVTQPSKELIKAARVSAMARR